MLSPTLREQTRKYKEMFEAMYLKQKANNSFFTGDTHVLDLTSRNVVARSLQNAAQQQEVDVASQNVAELPTTSTEVRHPGKLAAVASCNVGIIIMTWCRVYCLRC